jgi:hypothetical protein
MARAAHRRTDVDDVRVAARARSGQARRREGGAQLEVDASKLLLEYEDGRDDTLIVTVKP